ncbi:sugar phosphate isomerase/epimerase family protein [Rhodoglobus aureus]
MAFDEAARWCAGLGFDSLEVTVSEGWPTDVLRLLPGAAREWRSLSDDLGIVITSLTANAPIIVTGGDWSASLDRLRRCLALAAELQSPNQRMPISLGASWPREYGQTTTSIPESAWTQYRTLIVDRFGELARLARELGVRVALEPNVSTVVSRPEHALYVIAAIDDDALGINLDISHFAVQGDSIADIVRVLGPHALTSEVKDTVGVAPQFDFLVPGEGEFDFTGFVKGMKEVGFDGSIAVEISLRRQRIELYDAKEAAAAAYAVLSEAFAAAGVDRHSLKEK